MRGKKALRGAPVLTAQPVNSRDLGPRRGNLAIDWMIDRRERSSAAGLLSLVVVVFFFHMCTYTRMFFFNPPF